VKEDSDREFILNYLKHSRGISKKLEEQVINIEKATQLLFEAWQRNQKVYIMGNGGSASTASHLAADLAKTINDAPGKRGIHALTPWDNIPHISAIVNDRSKEDYFTAWLDTFYEGGRIGVGLSVHGGQGSDFGGKWSQNLLKGMQKIKDVGGQTIGIAGGGPLLEMVTVPLLIPVEDTSLKTPLVESFQVVIHHLIIFLLKKKIQEHQKSG
jgi:phosphoheptose isomerase